MSNKKSKRSIKRSTTTTNNTDTSIVAIGLQCPVCNEVIVSLHRHDFCKCGCGNTFIDGGFDYTRAGSENGQFGKSIIVRINSEYLRVKLPNSNNNKALPRVKLT